MNYPVFDSLLASFHVGFWLLTSDFFDPQIKTSIEILRVHLQNFEALLPEDLKGEVCGYSEGNGSNAAQRRSSMGNVYADSDAEMGTFLGSLLFTSIPST